jgi:hypothetical protein
MRVRPSVDDQSKDPQLQLNVNLYKKEDDINLSSSGRRPCFRSLKLTKKFINDLPKWHRLCSALGLP